MAQSKKAQSNARYRADLMQKLMDFCSNEDIGGAPEWVRQTASNSFAFLFVNDNGDEGTVKITVSFPTGDRSGEAYDYDLEADEYAAKVKRNKERAEKAAQLKAKKIEQDKKQREIIKKQKEKREKEGQ